jgi:class 3 adenylate cyclase
MRSYGECNRLADPAVGTGLSVPAPGRRDADRIGRPPSGGPAHRFGHDESSLRLRCLSDRAREERRTVSVLFADIVGFTDLAGQLDPEDVRAFQKAYFRAVSQVVRRWRGVVEKYVGDAVLAVFGAPRSDEYDAYRAVRAGLEIQEALAGLRLPGGSALQARVGVATGETVVDLAAVRDGGQALVSGDVVNTAARVQAHAAPGSVVVTAATHRATASLVRYQDLPSATVAGKPTPVAVWRACGAAPPPAVQLDGDGAPMLGRDAELSTLIKCLTRTVRERVPQLVSIVGPAGSGKSRLVRELASRAQDSEESPAQWWFGHCSPCGGDLYAALVDLARAFLTAAEHRPLILVVEDVHHAEPALVRFLCELATAARAAPQPLPLTVIATHLPGPAGLLSGAADAVVSLPPLSAAETRSLLGHLLDQAGQPAALADRLLPLAAGNPRYAEEYVRMFAEQAVDVSCRPTVDYPPMPERVRRMASARLDQVGEADRAVLQAAAVFGPDVWPDAIATLLGTDPAYAHAALRRLERHDLLVRRPSSAPTRQPEYAFSQVAIRQVAYLRLPRAVRIDHHRAAAQWLHTKAVANRPDVDEARARHWLAAFDLAQALHHDAEPYLIAACNALADAADGAMRRRAPNRAEHLARRALRLWPAAGATANRARLVMLARYASCLANTDQPAVGGSLAPTADGQARRPELADRRTGRRPRPPNGWSGTTVGRARSP